MQRKWAKLHMSKLTCIKNSTFLYMTENEIISNRYTIIQRRPHQPNTCIAVIAKVGLQLFVA